MRVESIITKFPVDPYWKREGRWSVEKFSQHGILWPAPQLADFYDLAHHYHPENFDNAGYFGPGPEAESLLYTTNTPNPWLFDRMPLESKSEDEPYAYIKTDIPFKKTILWNRFQKQEFYTSPNGFFQPQEDFKGVLGLRLFGNLHWMKAEIVDFKEMSRFRTDIYCVWRHPEDTESRKRILPFVWIPDPPRTRDKTPKDLEEALRENLPKFDFIMTRGFSSPRFEKIPYFQKILDHAGDGALLFLDRNLDDPRFESKPVPDYLQDEWSFNGTMRIYQKV